MRKYKLESCLIVGATPNSMGNGFVNLIERGLKEEIKNFDGVLLSPGPGSPNEAGECINIVNEAIKINKPLLGVCLGHQAIAEALGGKVSKAPELLHGKTSQVHHSDKSVLHGLRDGFTATRYHSLAIERDSIDSQESQLEITGWTDSGVVMAVCHKSLPIHGVQFHPESVLTEGGHHLLANWLQICGDNDALKKSEGLAPVIGK